MEQKTTIPIAGEEEEDGVFGFDLEMKEGVWCRLIPLHKDLKMVEFEGEGKKTVGRRAASSIVLNNPHTSGYHCFFCLYDNEVYVCDTSRNGTFVNNLNIGKGNRRALVTGDEVTFTHSGGYGFSVQVMTKGFHQRYQMGEVLGKGTYGEVRSAFCRKTGEKYAVKLIHIPTFQGEDKKKREARVQKIEREVDIMQQTRHKNIVSVVDAHQTEDTLYIVLELATGGELFYKIFDDGRFCESDARYVFSQILDAVDYLHEKRIAHRDIKLENILLADKKGLEIKITDFGMSRFMSEDEAMKTWCGTIEYVAPEIFQQKIHKDAGCEGRGYGLEVDMWSAGVVLYLLLSGVSPFDSTDANMFAKVKRGLQKFPPNEGWEMVSDDAKDLLRQLLVVNPKKRFTAKQAKEHKWVKSTKRLTKRLNTADNLRNSLNISKTQIAQILQEGEREEKEKADRKRKREDEKDGNIDKRPKQ